MLVWHLVLACVNTLGININIKLKVKMKASELKKMIERIQMDVGDFEFVIELHDVKGRPELYKIVGARDLHQTVSPKKYYFELIVGHKIKG